MNKFVLSFGLGLCCSAAASAQGWPGSVNLTFAGMLSGGSANIAFITGPGGAALAYNSTAAWNGNSVSNNVGARNLTYGSHTFVTYAAQTAATAFPASPNTFAVDTVALTDVPDGGAAQSPMGANKATIVQDLYARYYTDSLTSTVKSRAFQIALFEVIGERWDAPGTGLTTAAQIVAEIRSLGESNVLTIGQFRAGTSQAIVLDQLAVRAQAVTYLSGMGGVSGTDFWSSAINGFRTVGPTNYADQLLLVPIGAPGIIAGLGLVGVVALRRRRK